MISQSVSVKGIRDQNEDKHLSFMNKNKGDSKYINVNYFSLFDGHGGKEVSTYLYDNMYKYFIEKSIKYPLTNRYIINVYNKIQGELKNYEYSLGTGSTGLILINYFDNKDNIIHIINNGDSRAILCRNNLAVPLTKDHKPNWPEERIRITSLGGHITFDGSDYRIKDLSVSRAFGDIDTVPYVTHIPDIYKYKLDKNDKFIVMACDGLWDVVSNDEVVNYILNNFYESDLKIKKNIESVCAAKNLAKLALKKGSTDNITIIVIFL
jgi:serine/threonine protein phosphatase PrpC